MGQEHFQVLTAIVNSEGEPDHFWRDLTSASPRLNKPRLTRFLALNLLLKFRVDVWAFFD